MNTNALLSKGEDIRRTGEGKKKENLCLESVILGKTLLFVEDIRHRIFAGQINPDSFMEKNCYYMTVLGKQFSSGPWPILEGP